MVRIILLIIFGAAFAFSAVRAVIAAASLVLDFGQGGHNSSTILGAMVGSMVMAFLFAYLFKRSYTLKKD